MAMRDKIKVAIAGVGNCASALLQGMEYYRRSQGDYTGLLHKDMGGYGPCDINVVAAFDVDARKVGKPLHEAAFAHPNCTYTIWPDLPDYGVIVNMAPVLDGVSPHMADYPSERTFVVAQEEPCNVSQVLRESGAEMLINYVPVGSEEAARFYASCCLETGVSFINCMPAFIVSDPGWASRFERRGIPVVGDDIKSQFGATVVHRILAKLLDQRGAKLLRTYQLNTGGNTDFLNMLNRDRLKSKRHSKTQSVQSQLEVPLEPENIHIGPSDYVPWQNDNKVCFLRIEGEGFGRFPFSLELRLSVEDSPNSAGMVIDAIRFCRIARSRGDAGPLFPISAHTMKHPPKQIPEPVALELIHNYLQGADRPALTLEANDEGGDIGGRPGYPFA